LRTGLPPLIPRIAKLPIDERGYPIPFFVGEIDGKLDFRFMDRKKWVRCIKEKICWVCGEPLGVHLACVIGPMCAITRTTSEPPAHLDCALWSVKGCPFLSRPKMVRHEDDLTRDAEDNAAGIPILRNPGSMCLWTTDSYKVFFDHQRRPLIRIGDPEAISWWREGRTATRAEIMESVDNGYPSLLEMCELEKTPDRREAALKDLAKAREEFMRLLDCFKGYA
jgi:hypothetical protein